MRAELKVQARTFCSFHYHEHRANRFIVKSGKLRVVSSMGGILSFHDLSADNILDVPSLVPHQFQVLESGEVIEEYWPDRGGFCQESDIVRFTQGGTIDGSESWSPILSTEVNILISC